MEWYTKRNLAKTTRDGYTDSINKYINYLNRNGADYTLEKLLKEAEADERSGELLRYCKINKHIISFINHMEEIENSPGTINNRIAAIKSFYETMDITIPYIQKKKGNTVLEKNQGAILTREEILINRRGQSERSGYYLYYGSHWACAK
ncbi:phage integrase N-terminal SAM-like domain-containing protein [Methanobacterium sp. SMA-27]|uniref:phage integrase N-terminal SAM-like domain-containing protein n=1 Tax=Methanobacterium sp. SMA-27 TaxID=1495336 RepID=UPI00064E5C28|nr:phage integrase N-terminal SAM-like domain-containing protein [Methanobacterium sp. SMA-27]